MKIRIKQNVKISFLSIEIKPIPYNTTSNSTYDIKGNLGEQT